MGKINLSNIKLIKEKILRNSKGNIFRFINKNQTGYKGFGEVYFSWINSYKIKAWKKHSQMTMNLSVPVGKVKFKFVDQKTMKTKTVVTGKDNYFRITVPPGIWFGFKNLSKRPSLVVNFSNIKHRDKEVKRVKENFFKVNWK